jgi:DNA polymerase-3 subunit beta
MKFIISRDNLNHGLNAVVSVIPSKPSHPILATILLEAKNDAVVFTGFDLVTSIRVKIDAIVEKTGTIALPIASLKPLISRIEEQNITIEVVDNIAVITTNSGSFRISASDPFYYPEIKLPEIDYEIELNTEIFVEGLNNVGFACSRDDTKQILTGISITCKNGKLEFAATDGHRLAVSSVDIENMVENFKIVLPLNGAREIIKLIKGNENFKLKVSKNKQIQIDIGDDRIITRLLAGDYPNYNQLIPINWAISQKFEKKQLISKIEIVQIIADAKNHLVKWNIDKNHLTLEAANEGDNALETIKYLEKDFTPITIGFNSKYLLDGLKMIPGNNIQINLNKPNTPVVFNGDYQKHEYKYLVMPVQILK